MIEIATLPGPPRWVGVAASALAAAIVASHLLNRWVDAPRRPRQGRVDTRVDGDSAGRPARPRPGLRRHPPPPHPTAVAAWLDDVARSTRVGTSLRDAIATPAPEPLATHLRPLQRRLDTGNTVGDAVDRWRTDLPADESLLTAATALLVTDEVGGSVAAPLERAAALLRARAAEADERASWAAQALLSARVLAGLPPAVLVGFAVIDRRVLEVVLSPSGVGLLTVGLGLDAIGFAWMRRIVGREAT